MNNQYEPCEHRRGSGLMGSYRDYYDTPCDVCAKLDKQSNKNISVSWWVLVAIVIVAVVALVGRVEA